MYKLYSMDQKWRLLQFILPRLNLQLLQWRVKSTFGMLNLETCWGCFMRICKVVEVILVKFHQRTIRVTNILRHWLTLHVEIIFTEVERVNTFMSLTLVIECFWLRSRWHKIRIFKGLSISWIPVMLKMECLLISSRFRLKIRFILRMKVRVRSCLALRGSTYLCFYQDILDKIEVVGWGEAYHR